MRIEEKTRFERDRAAADTAAVEGPDRERLAIKGMVKRRYEERAQMYEAARAAPQSFDRDKAQSTLFARDAFYGGKSVPYNGIRGMYGLLCTAPVLDTPSIFK
jgi:hypothetical protein